MTGDFTRDTFRPAKGYSSVRMQQGRLFTDADWNEQGDIARAALRGTARSVIGPSGMPEDNPGFAVLAGAAKKTLLIGGGQAYVDGIGIAFTAPVRLDLARQSGAGAATRWRLEAGERVAVGDYLVLAGNPLDQAVRVDTLHPDLAGRQIFQCAAALSANAAIAVDRYRSAESQPFWPANALPAVADTYLAYLDVWEREVSAADDPLLRETAFGGPDTAQREQIVWQVRFARTADLVAAGAVAAPVSCSSFLPGWSPFGPGSHATLAARATAAAAVVDPCALPASGGYRSLENHLYRVEVHNGGSNSGTFKWSRDNAIHDARYAEIDNGALIVDSVGKDEPTALKKDDWVEVLDEARILTGQPGFFARISDLNGKRVSLGEVRHPDTLVAITNAGAPDLTVLPAAGIIRRWEGGLPVAVLPGQWVALENGVEVHFLAGRFATCDHWLIPARSLSATIEWPLDEATGEGAHLPPHGIVHHYAALALATRAANGDWTVDSDCRTLFPPLTALKSFLYLGGDGQEALPDPLAPATRIALGSSLQVGVVRGKTPVAGQSVRFEITLGDGRLGALADNLKIRTVQTNPDGIATMDWSLDAALPVQRVVARLLNSGGTPTHLPITFSAELRTAAVVSYDPANTPLLAGANTVQEAIEKLAGQQQIGCSTYVITEGSNWTAILEALKPGEDAAICFQRGTFTTDKPVVIKGMGHLSLHGAGDGTRIIANRTECALQFEDCASVTLRDLELKAPDGSGAIGPIMFRQGVVTILNCPTVSASDLSLRCGGGAKTERTGITVRGSTEKPLESVSICHNRLAIGLAQDGILVTDAVKTLIADNEIAVVPGKAGVRPERLFEGAAWRKRLASILVARPIAAARPEGGLREFRKGRVRVRYDSPLPQEEWDRLFSADPPTDADLRSAATAEAYVARIADSVVADPSKSKTYERSLRTLDGRVGRMRRDAIENDVKRSLVLASDPKAEPERTPRGDDGQIVVEAGSIAAQFGSPVSQADWNKALKLMPPRDVQALPDLIKHLRRVAFRMVSDEDFRSTLGSVVNWLSGFTKAMPTYGRQAIVCGGATLSDCTVRGNRVVGFVQGVHIGVSREDDKPARAGSVSIADNHLTLRKPGEEVYVPMGLFCGNVETVRIQRNILDWALPRPRAPFNHGIRVWGLIGKYLKIADNRVSIARIGIAIQPSVPPDADVVPSQLWLVADNLVENVPPVDVVHAPPFTIKRDNRPH